VFQGVIRDREQDVAARAHIGMCSVCAYRANGAAAERKPPAFAGDEIKVTRNKFATGQQR
jgi:hypothetical protein